MGMCRSFILSLRNYNNGTLCSGALNTIQQLGFTKVRNRRGKKAGKKFWSASASGTVNSISPRITERPLKHHLSNLINTSNFKNPESAQTLESIGANFGNLIAVPIVKRQSVYELANRITICLWNARSINNKISAICDYIVDNDTDIFAVTETWLGLHQCSINELLASLPGYNFYHCPRAGKRGGGVAFIVRPNINVTVNILQHFHYFEYMDITINVSGIVSRIILVYRPPSNKGNSSLSFLREFSTLMESLLTAENRLIVLGDFNFHVEDPNNSDAQKFLTMIADFGLVQHVNVSTHIKGHTLDLVMSRVTDSYVLDLSVDHILPSDHSLIKFKTDLSRPSVSRLEIKTRNIRSINTNDLIKLTQSIHVPDNCSDLAIDLLAEQFHLKLEQVMNEVAPIKTRHICNKPSAPWYDNDLRKEKQTVRKRERQWLAHPLEVNKLMFHASRSEYHYHVNEAKIAFQRNRIMESNQQQLFAIIDHITGTKASSAALPSYEDTSLLAQRFSDYFSGKISKLREQLSQLSCTETGIGVRGGGGGAGGRSPPQIGQKRLIHSGKMRQP